MKDSFKNTFLFFVFFSLGFICFGQQKIITGAERIPEYIDRLKHQNIGIVANKSSILSINSHIIDTLLSYGINILKSLSLNMALEGRQTQEKIISQKDPKTGLTILSLTVTKENQLRNSSKMYQLWSLIFKMLG